MVTLSETIQIIIGVSSVWITGCFSVEPEPITCSTTIDLSPTTAKVFRYGDGVGPYPQTQVCRTMFQALDPDLKILIFLTAHCDGLGDTLEIPEGSTNLCCFDCTKELLFDRNAVSVKFSSDSTTDPRERGFDIKMIVGKNESNCSPSITTIDVGTAPVIITSPNFPEKYPKSLTCTYIIKSSNPTSGLALSFDFINLDFDSRTGCYDKIILREDDENGTLIKEICNGYNDKNFNIPENENYSTSGQLYLQFQSDSSVVAYGFRVTIRQASATTEAQTVVPSTTSQSTSVSLTTTTTTETSLSTSATTSSTVIPSVTITTASHTTSPSTSTSETTITTAILVTSLTSTEASETVTPTTAVLPTTVTSAATSSASTTTVDQTTTTTTTVSSQTTTTSTTELPSTTKSYEGMPASGLNSYFTETTITILVCLIVFLIAIILCVTVLMCIYVRKRKLKKKRCSQNIFEDDLKYDNNQMSSLYLFYWSAR